MKFSMAVFKDQNSSRLFVGQFISQICDKMMTLGLVWVISQEQSIQMIPWFLAIGALPHLLLASSGGKLVQRIGVLRTLIHTDVLRGIIFLLVGLLWLAYFKHHSLTTLFILTFVSNLLGALFNIAVFTLPGLMPKKELVPQLTAMVDSCFSLGTVVGPAISALLYPWLGLSGLLVLNGLSYLLAAGLEGGIRLDPADPENGRTGAGECRHGASDTRAVDVCRSLDTLHVVGIFPDESCADTLDGLAPLVCPDPIRRQSCHAGRLRGVDRHGDGGGKFCCFRSWNFRSKGASGRSPA